LGWLLARTLTAPVRELTAATQAMAAGDLNQRVAVHTHDEIGNLAHSFNQMSADLARASQLRKQMTADLAHDLRTPLSILRGYLEGLKEDQLQGTPALYILMHEEVLHLQRLVEDLRVLSLADAGELPLNRRMVDPTALLERTGLLYYVAAEQQGVHLRVEAAENLPSIQVDTDRLTQVLNNLVSNALRHTRQGEILLGARANNTNVELSIRDTGSGIDAEDLPFVFDRFYRGDKSRQRMDDGASSGLGLAIAKAIVEAHGGTIQVESTAGSGTTFTIILPAAAQAPSSNTPQIESETIEG
jgi:two-component system sensor histidine kinase BaeS